MSNRIAAVATALLLGGFTGSCGADKGPAMSVLDGQHGKDNIGDLASGDGSVHPDDTAVPDSPDSLDSPDGMEAEMTSVSIQLTWHVPTNDSVNLDLHLLNPDGHAAWRVDRGSAEGFFNYPSDFWETWESEPPDWGESGPEGNPQMSHEPDPVTGEPMETITFESSTGSHLVGVHYECVAPVLPSGPVATYVTVRVYVEQQLVFEVADVMLASTGVLWSVATVELPKGKVQIATDESGQYSFLPLGHECPECIDGKCICQPDCEGKDCGENGCGDTCGNCPDGKTCTGGKCICQPNCNDKECGDDGCGSSCGECQPQDYCGAGQCVPMCGDGTCAGAEDCSTCPEDCGQCPPECQPECQPELETCVSVDGSPTCVAATAAVPAGEFWMGCNNCEGSVVSDSQCEADEHPYHPVQLDAYQIDLTEVTVAQYGACVDAGTCDEPGAFPKCNWGSEGQDQHPVNCIAWDDAHTYCQWVGKRLPTEAEWEKAARGGCEFYGNCKNESRKFPWGNTFPGACDNLTAVYPGCSCSGGTCPVGTHPDGVSKYGAHDMIGNLWEWTNDNYQQDYYCLGKDAEGITPCNFCSEWPGAPLPWENPPCPDSGTTRSIRGGYFGSSNFEFLRNSFRADTEPANQEFFLGFRCARDP